MYFNSQITLEVVTCEMEMRNQSENSQKTEVCYTYTSCLLDFTCSAWDIEEQIIVERKKGGRKEGN